MGWGMNRKAALITGSAIRIGREIAINLAENGYDIGIHYNSSEKEAKQTESEIIRNGVSCAVLKADLSNHKDVISLAERMADKFPNWGLLVNSASVFGQENYSNTTEQIFNDHMNINFKAPFFLGQKFAEFAGENSHIINILDTKINKTMENRFIYLLSKKSLAELTLMQARVLGTKIRVNGIAVGVTEISRDLDIEYVEKLKKRLPLSRIASLKDITDAVIMLERHKGITGQIVNIDGGESVLW
jgi:pteridine reductase